MGGYFLPGVRSPWLPASHAVYSIYFQYKLNLKPDLYRQRYHSPTGYKQILFSTFDPPNLRNTAVCTELARFVPVTMTSSSRHTVATFDKSCVKFPITYNQALRVLLCLWPNAWSPSGTLSLTWFVTIISLLPSFLILIVTLWHGAHFCKALRIIFGRRNEIERTERIVPQVV